MELESILANLSSCSNQNNLFDNNTSLKNMNQTYDKENNEISLEKRDNQQVFFKKESKNSTNMECKYQQNINKSGHEQQQQQQCKIENNTYFNEKQIKLSKNSTQRLIKKSKCIKAQKNHFQNSGSSLCGLESSRKDLYQVHIKQNCFKKQRKNSNLTKRKYCDTQNNKDKNPQIEEDQGLFTGSCSSSIEDLNQQQNDSCTFQAKEGNSSSILEQFEEDVDQQIKQNNSQDKQEQIQKRQKKKLVVKSIVAIDIENPTSSFKLQDGSQSYVIMNPLQGFYFISGDICVMNHLFQKEEFTHFSDLNNFKAPVKTYKNLNSSCLEIDLKNKRSGIKNFQFLIEKLRSYSSQGAYNFSILLEKYQKAIDDLQEKRNLIKDEQSMYIYSKFLEDSYDKFQMNFTEILKSFAQKHTFYQYTVYRLNLFNFEMQMHKTGFSEPLLALLGLDLTQAQQYIWRKGLFTYQDRINIQHMLCCLIKYKLGYTETKPIDVILHTFDSQIVYAVNNVQIFMDQDSHNPFLPYNQIILISSFDISHTMIKQVMEIRQLTKQKSIKYIRDLEEDLSYSMEATIFLEKYYRNKAQNFLPSNKKAGYRLIDK